jgi:malate dehydrogenase (oxaloacetate-decarboxylating)
MTPSQMWIAQHTNPSGKEGTLGDAAEGADVFIGVSGPGAFPLKYIKRMNPNPMIFALANPVPEISPEEVEGHVAIIATGRSDYPNQINNVLAFPGIFRGALDVRASQITEGMKVAAARALADAIPPEALNAEFIIPSVFDRTVAERVAAAVSEAAIQEGVARRVPKGPGVV